MVEMKLVMVEMKPVMVEMKPVMVEMKSIGKVEMRRFHFGNVRFRAVLIHYRSCVDYIKGLFIKAALKYTRVPTVSYDSGMDMAWKCDVPYINIIYLLRNKHFIRSDSKLKSSLVLKGICMKSVSEHKV